MKTPAQWKAWFESEEFALSSYTAQNLGARQPERVVQGYRAANGMVIGCAAVICLILESFHGPIIRLFLGQRTMPIRICPKRPW